MKKKKKKPLRSSNAPDSGDAPRPERTADPTPGDDSEGIEKSKRVHQNLLGSVLTSLTKKTPVASVWKEERSVELSSADYLRRVASSGNREELNRALTDLQAGGSEIPAQRRNELIETLMTAAVEEELIAKYAQDDPPSATWLIVTADAARISMANILRQVETAGQRRALTKQLLSGYARRKLDNAPAIDNFRGADSLGPELYAWIWDPDTLKVADDWNKKEDGLAGKVYNHLWNSGQYDKICELIRMGVDTMQPCVLPRDTGRDNDEGVWSGYIQPLEHLLSKYLKRIAQLDAGTLREGEDRAKVEGARQVLAELARRKPPPGILTSYDSVQESPLLREFKEHPGTFWGFEDVRLPYVEAARETEHGLRPLRMMDMWDAVQEALHPDNFGKLLESPEETIDMCMKKGRAAAEEGFEAAVRGERLSNSRVDYWDIKDKEAYMRVFEEQARSFLSFLSRQSPEAKFMTAELSGRDASKLMGALACKAGLWWARNKNERVYYCLDGINLEDVASYKTYKTKLINAGFKKRAGEVGPSDLYYEVITFSELREILRSENWPKLRDTVRFVHKGEILTGEGLAEIEQVRQIIANEGKAQRESPPRKVLNKEARGLGMDPGLTLKMDDNVLRKAVAKIHALKLGAKAEDISLFLRWLHDTEILIEHGMLGRHIYGMFHQLALEKDPSNRKTRADEIVEALAEGASSDSLREALTETARRMSTAPPTEPNLLIPPDSDAEVLPFGTVM